MPPELAEMSPARAGRWLHAQVRTAEVARAAPPGAAGVGARMAAARARARLSVRELAARCDVCHTTIRRWESGEVAPGVDDVERVAKALDMAPRDLVGWG